MFRKSFIYRFRLYLCMGILEKIELGTFDNIPKYLNYPV